MYIQHHLIPQEQNGLLEKHADYLLEMVPGLRLAQGFSGSALASLSQYCARSHSSSVWMTALKCL